jgi:hypothetical protein
MERKSGAYTLPAIMDVNKAEGGFRPSNFAADEYVYFHIYDVSQVCCRPLKNEVVYTNASKTKVYLESRRNWLDGSWRFNRQAMRANQLPRSRASSVYVLGDKISRTKPANNKVLVCANLSSVFWKGNDLYLFYENNSTYFVLGIDGQLSERNDISFKFPGLGSDKGHEIVQDAYTEEFYLVVATNSFYYWYLIDELNNETILVKKFDNVWKDPNWQLRDQEITYEYPSGKTKEIKSISLRD